MRRLRMLAAPLLVGIVALSACTSGSSSKDYQFDGVQTAPKLIPVADRKPAENFDGSLLQGGTYDLAKNAAGKITVVNFWGSWCGPCQVETPQFSQTYLQYKTKGVTFVGIAIGEPSAGITESWVRLHKIAYPIVYDEEGKTALTLGNISITTAPYTVILDGEHRVAGVYATRLDPQDLTALLNLLTAEN